MRRGRLRFVGVELYFRNLKAARRFYRETLGLRVTDEEPGRYARFKGRAGFLCLEKKGSESYPSRDRAVVFFEVADLSAAVKAIGRGRFVHVETKARSKRPAWAVLHDPEGHNVLLLQARKA